MQIRKKNICSSKECFTQPYHKDSVYIETVLTWQKKREKKQEVVRSAQVPGVKAAHMGKSLCFALI